MQADAPERALSRPRPHIRHATDETLDRLKASVHAEDVEGWTPGLHHPGKKWRVTVFLFGMEITILLKRTENIRDVQQQCFMQDWLGNSAHQKDKTKAKHMNISVKVSREVDLLPDGPQQQRSKTRS